MTPLKSLPIRPSLESLRKQAKKLARDIAAGNPEAVARAQAHLPGAPPLSQRDAQLALALEYGFAGWQDLKAVVLKRLGQGLEWAAAQAEHAIHDNDTDRLRQLLTEYPALISSRDESGDSLVAYAASSFGDSGDPYREERFTRPDCVALLIDAGATIDPPVWQNVISTRARGMLQLLWSKGALPRTLLTLTALGDLEAVRALADEAAPAALGAAFLTACRWPHKAVASFLLDRCIAAEPDLGQRIDHWQSRPAFVDYLTTHTEQYSAPWRTFVMNQAMQAIAGDDPQAFASWLQQEPGLLADPCIDLQVQMLERATLQNRPKLIQALFDLHPAVLRSPTPPPSSAIIFALEYAHAHLIPLLTRIWPLPDDLPHAAGTGNLARVKRWFDAAGRPALGNIYAHNPANSPGALRNLHWTPPNAQHILDLALAWACLNRRFEIAGFLLDHGADINTNWSTHEPASILHECAIQGNFEAAQFLLDRGIDTTILDHRWNATAEGWAYHAAKNKPMAELIAKAARPQKQ